MKDRERTVTGWGIHRASQDVVAGGEERERQAANREYFG